MSDPRNARQLLARDDVAKVNKSAHGCAEHQNAYFQTAKHERRSEIKIPNVLSFVGGFLHQHIPGQAIATRKNVNKGKE